MMRRIRILLVSILCGWLMLAAPSAMAEAAKKAKPKAAKTAKAKAKKEAVPKTTATGERNFAMWEKDIAAFEAQDKTAPPPKGAVLFIGSSMIKRWTNVAQDFPELTAINRGFGGCHIEDCTHFAERIAIPYAPRLVVLGCGGNDIHSGKTNERVAADFKAFVEKIHTALPAAKIVFISLNPRIVRWSECEATKAVNALIKKYCADKPYLDYVETYAMLLDKDGQPRPELFAKDKLHYSESGYKILIDILRPHLGK